MQKTHITDYLKWHAVNQPDKLALVSDEREFSWSELYKEARLRAGFIASKLGNEQQQIVGLMMNNSWQLVIAYLAVLEAGHIGMPIDVIYKPLEIGAIIDQMQPVLTIVDKPNQSRLKEHSAILFDDIPSLKNENYLRQPAKQQIASLVFTSGTTGKPKAAPYTHANHLWNIKVCSEAWGWQANDTMLLSLRLSHWYGVCMGLTGAIYHGNTLYLEGGFDPKKTLTRLSSGKISLFTHTPIAYARMLEEPGTFDLSKARLLISGSAALAPDIWQAYKDKYGIEIIECYGSSETGRIASNTADDRLPGNPGFALPAVQLKLGAHDELLVKSPGLFPGYYNNPAQTKKNMAEDGYWRTGDIAEIKNGRIYLKGRLQERIRKQGYSVSPRDVEWALRENNNIVDCLVVGIPGQDEDNNQLIYFIVGDIKEDELLVYAKENLPSIWRPDRVIMLDSLHRRPNGKPDLAKLKTLINAT